MAIMREKSCFKQTERTYKNHIGITHPEIAKTLHPHKNIYRIENLTQGSDSRSVWWLCPTCNSEWQCSPFKRIQKNQTCPTCRAKQIPKVETLGYCYPHLIEEWHPTQNEPLDPFSITSYSGRQIWWRCKDCAHEWRTRAYSRTRAGSGCPICQRKKHHDYLRKINRIERENNLLVTHPHLEVAWDAEKNHPLTLKHVTAKSNRQTWWCCTHCDHSFLKRTLDFIGRKSDQICPSCQKPIYLESDLTEKKRQNLLVF